MARPTAFLAALLCVMLAGASVVHAGAPAFDKPPRECISKWGRSPGSQAPQLLASCLVMSVLRPLLAGPAPLWAPRKSTVLQAVAWGRPSAAPAWHLQAHLTP